MTHTEKHLSAGNILEAHFHTGDSLTGCVIETVAFGVLLYLGSPQGKGREISLVPWGSIRHLQSTGKQTLIAARPGTADLDLLLKVSERERAEMREKEGWEKK